MSGSGMAAQLRQDAVAGGRGSAPDGDDGSNLIRLSQVSEPDVNKSVPGGDEKMTDHPTREEMNAKLEATEARMENKLDAIVRSIDSVKDELRNQGTVAALRFDHIDERVSDAKTAANDARYAAIDAQRATSTLRWNIVATGLSVAALFITVFAVWNDAIGTVEGLLRPQFEVQEAMPSHTAPAAPMPPPAAPSP
jgi:hypothetical protein